MSLLPLSPAAERTKALQGKAELFLHSLSQAICPSFAIPINNLFLIMYYHTSHKLKLKMRTEELKKVYLVFDHLFQLKTKKIMKINQNENKID